MVEVSLVLCSMDSRKERRKCGAVVAAKCQSGLVTWTHKGGLSVEIRFYGFYIPPIAPTPTGQVFSKYICYSRLYIVF